MIELKEVSSVQCEGFLMKLRYLETERGNWALTSVLKIVAKGRSSVKMSIKNGLGGRWTYEGDEESNPVSWSEDFLPRSSSYDCFFLFYGSHDLSEFGLRVGVILGSFSDPSKVLERELILVLGSEPSGTLFHEWDNASHDSDWYQLETDGNSPLKISTSWVDESDTISDPVRS